jgi:hypothetical protein
LSNESGNGISILVPFRADDAGRAATWAWLKRYWTWALPGAELIVGRDDGVPFSKSCAVNDAAKRATGDVFVLMDADAYLAAEAVTHVAMELRSSHARTWCMPYKGFWRINRGRSQDLLDTDPRQAMQIRLPPKPENVQGGKAAWEYAYHLRAFCGLCMVLPAAAFREVGGMDPRFRGWGSEDSSFGMALDTLWAPRRYCDDHEAAHLWHARIGEGLGSQGRMWEGQAKPKAGFALREEYTRRNGNVRAMRSFVDEGLRG